MSNEYEHTLETALDKLEDSVLSKYEVEVIRLACGKSTGQLVAERNHQLLDSMFQDLGKVFCK